MQRLAAIWAVGPSSGPTGPEQYLFLMSPASGPPLQFTNSRIHYLLESTFGLRKHRQRTQDSVYLEPHFESRSECPKPRTRFRSLKSVWGSFSAKPETALVHRPTVVDCNSS